MTNSKSIVEIIRQRFSCRSYLELPIEAETRQLLADYAISNQTGPFGTLMRFELVAAPEQDRKTLRSLGTYGFIKGATGFIIGATMDGGNNLEDYGYLLEKIILFATNLGLGTCWLGGTFTKSSFAEKISVREGELTPAVASVGYIAKDQRILEKVIRRGADADKRFLWERLFFDTRFDAPLSRETASDYALPLEMVRISPSASNRQPWRIVKEGNRWHFYLRRTPGYRERMLVRLFTVADLQRIDIGIAMSHFELTASELGLDGYWEIDEPKTKNPDEFTEYKVSWVEDPSMYESTNRAE